jgi:ABC-2 type transport system ATP-binding protein
VTRSGGLGRNGAGKTTTVRILTTLIQLDAGQAEVAGHSAAAGPGPDRRHRAERDHGRAAYRRQNLDIIARLCHLGAARTRQRANELLGQFGPGALSRPTR